MVRWGGAEGWNKEGLGRLVCASFLGVVGYWRASETLASMLLYSVFTIHLAIQRTFTLSPAYRYSQIGLPTLRLFTSLGNMLYPQIIADGIWQSRGDCYSDGVQIQPCAALPIHFANRQFHSPHNSLSTRPLPYFATVSACRCPGGILSGRVRQ